MSTSRRRRDKDILRLMERVLSCKGSDMPMLSAKRFTELSLSGPDSSLTGSAGASIWAACTQVPEWSPWGASTPFSSHSLCDTCAHAFKSTGGDYLRSHTGLSIGLRHEVHAHTNRYFEPSILHSRAPTFIREFLACLAVPHVVLLFT